MKPTLVEMLRCPEHGGRLRLAAGLPPESGEVEAGRLECADGHGFEIREGVPLLVPESLAPGQAETRESFSEKWRRAPGYRENTREHYVRWYLERYGHGSLERLEAFLSDKRRILDAGTGHGRDAELYARHSRASVYGVDLSDGIFNAQRDLADLPDLHLVQADLTRLPFPPAFFDFIACDQVIHHTPDTRESLRALLRHLAPGGTIAFYVYKRKGPIREFCDDYLRRSTTQMSVEECLRFSEAMTQFGRSLARMQATINVPADLPLLEINAGRYDLQRFLYWNVFKCYWNEGIDYDSNVITNFDWYHPLHAHRHTPEEVRGWCEAEGLAIDHFSVVESGISVIARRVS